LITAGRAAEDLCLDYSLVIQLFLIGLIDILCSIILQSFFVIGMGERDR
jgi:hypothetical protein